MMDVDRISPLHAGTVNRLQAILFGILGSNVIISVHNPVQLDRYNQPEPDFAILKPRHDFYKNAHPTPADVLLIIEVADTSVAYDRLEKMPRYAAAGIPEVWLLNALEKYIEQYSEPTPSGYGRMQRLGIDAVIKATQIEGLELPISQMLSNEEK